MGRPKKDMSGDIVRILVLLRDHAPGPKSASKVSTARMAEELGFSAGKVKILRRSMVDDGLIEVTERVAENGGQLENSYRITRKGRRMIAASESENLVCAPQP